MRWIVPIAIAILVGYSTMLISGSLIQDRTNSFPIGIGAAGLVLAGYLHLLVVRK